MVKGKRGTLDRPLPSAVAAAAASSKGRRTQDIKFQSLNARQVKPSELKHKSNWMDEMRVVRLEPRSWEAFGVGLDLAIRFNLRTYLISGQLELR